MFAYNASIPVPIHKIPKAKGDVYDNFRALFPVEQLELDLNSLMGSNLNTARLYIIIYRKNQGNLIGLCTKGLCLVPVS